jgi:hypothetical protein
VKTKNRSPGWDSQAIHEIARDRFGDLRGLFEHHNWPERGRAMMPQVQRRVVESYGSIEAFAAHFGSGHRAR